jgi:hypothetical protein
MHRQESLRQAPQDPAGCAAVALGIAVEERAYFYVLTFAIFLLFSRLIGSLFTTRILSCM